MQLPLPTLRKEQIILCLKEGCSGRGIPSVQEMQTIAAYLVILIGLACMVLACVQIVTLRMLIYRHHHEQTAHIEAMTILAVAMQPSDTREHSVRVADIAKKVARELKLSSGRVTLVHTAGLLHEIAGLASLSCDSVESAILIVADYFDTAMNDHGGSMNLDKAMEEVRRGAGTRFDPVVVRALLVVGAAGAISSA